jgi:Flp pilus assembly secretin CpaC
LPGKANGTVLDKNDIINLMGTEENDTVIWVLRVIEVRKQASYTAIIITLLG